jgi:hypothetical protein
MEDAKTAVSSEIEQARVDYVKAQQNWEEVHNSYNRGDATIEDDRAAGMIRDNALARLNKLRADAASTS